MGGWCQSMVDNVQNGLSPVMVAAERRGIFTFSLALSHCCLPSQPVLVYSLHTAQNSMQDTHLIVCLVHCVYSTQVQTQNWHDNIQYYQN